VQRVPNANTPHDSTTESTRAQGGREGKWGSGHLDSISQERGQHLVDVCRKLPAEGSADVPHEDHEGLAVSNQSREGNLLSR
jgi:hypothetical protein